MSKYIVLIVSLILQSTNFFAQSPIDIVDNTFKIPGLGEEIFYYGFAEGDQLIFNFHELNNKELKEIEIMELPASSKFMDYKTFKIENKILQINKTGIYKFRLSNSSIGGRVCKVKIQRIPADDLNKKFNTNVYWKTVHDTVYRTVQEKYLIKRNLKPVAVVPTSEFYINSGANANLQGGKSRITFPVTLPKGTQEWYYVFSASRNKEDIEKVKNSMNLIGQLSSLIDNTGILNISVDMLTKPPGGNVCDVYLMDFDNSRIFESKQPYRFMVNGTRENIKSGIVKMPDAIGGQTYYIGMKNPDSFYGIQVVVEVVAITLEEEWGIRDVQKNSVSSRKVPYLQN